MPTRDCDHEYDRRRYDLYENEWNDMALESLIASIMHSDWCKDKSMARYFPSVGLNCEDESAMVSQS